MKSIIVTGCSSGIGAYCAEALKRDGWRVFATVRKPEDMAALEAKGIENYEDLTRTIPGARPAGSLRLSKRAILPFCRTRVRTKPPITG